MSSKRLLVLTSTFPRWTGDATPSFVHDLCLGLKDFEVHVLAPHHAGASRYEKIDNMHVHRFRYAPEVLEVLAYEGGIAGKINRNPFYLFSVPLFLIAQLFSILSLCRRYKFSIVHAHWLYPQGLLAALTGQRYVVTSHGSDLLSFNGFIMSRLKSYVLRRAIKITVVGEHMKSSILSLGGSSDKLHVMPMGVDVSLRFTPPASYSYKRGKEILSIAALVKKKGLDTLIYAFSTLLVHDPGWSLTLVGSGPDALQLQSLAKKLGILDSINFEGAVSNDLLPIYYRRSSMFVLPSFSEGFGIVAIEAMACACPVILSDIPSLRFIADDGEAGVLVSPGDSNALGNALLEIASNSSRREKLAQKGYERAQVFNWEKVWDRYNTLLLDVADSN